MFDRWYLILPFCSGLLYAVSAIALKPAMERGLGMWRISALTQWTMSLIFSLFLFGVEGDLLPDPFWPSLVAGLLFFLGGLATIIAINYGDVSVATPVMGSKVVLVAFIVVFFLDESLSIQVWIAAGLTFIGVLALNFGKKGSGAGRKKALMTILIAFLSSVLFATVDVMTQHWCAIQGFNRFVGWSSICAGAFAFLLIPKFKAPIWQIPKGVMPYLSFGAIGMAVQAIGMALGVGCFEDATGSNIVYSGRGMWSVVLVWWIGHWFHNQEKEAGRETMIGRLIGSVLIFAAIVILFL